MSVLGKRDRTEPPVWVTKAESAIKQGDLTKFTKAVGNHFVTLKWGIVCEYETFLLDIAIQLGKLDIVNSFVQDYKTRTYSGLIEIAVCKAQLPVLQWIVGNLGDPLSIKEVITIAHVSTLYGHTSITEWLISLQLIDEHRHAIANIIRIHEISSQIIELKKQFAALDIELRERDPTDEYVYDITHYRK